MLVDEDWTRYVQFSAAEPPHESATKMVLGNT